MSAARRLRPRGAAVLAAVLLAALTLVGARPGLAQGGARTAAAARAPGGPHSVGVRLARGIVRIGERVGYRGYLAGGGPGRARFLPPDSGGAFSWGTPATRARLDRGKPPAPDANGWFDFAEGETLFVDVPLQAFALGELSIPGLAVEIDDGAGRRRGRLPTTRLVVVPTLTPADSNAQLSPLRGPIAAPWWERVPWTRVGIGLGALAGLAALIVWLRRRRPVAPLAVPAVARRDPAAEALGELAALRRLMLPAAGRFADHAFALGRIVRRFLEAVAGTPRPGDSTPELMVHLEAARLDPEDLKRIEGLMRFWDRVKFARAPETVEEASRAEEAVENLVRRLGPAAAGGSGTPGKAA